MLIFQFGLYAHPLIYGDYPEVVKERIAKRSLLQGYPRSRLPEFTQQEINLTAGTVDFFGINHYRSYYAGVKKHNIKLRGIFVDSEIETTPIEKPKVSRHCQIMNEIIVCFLQKYLIKV